MKPVVYNGHYIVNENKMDFDQPVEIHFTRFGNSPHRCEESCLFNFHSNETYKVFCNFNEPTTSESTETTENVIKYANLYDLILTSRDEVLESCSNAVFFPYGTTWLHKDIDHLDGIGFYHPSLDQLHDNKTDTVSFLMTSHKNKVGYDIRHVVWNNANQIPNKVFYSGTRNPVCTNSLLPDDDKKHLFRSKFSIIIESTKEENYFTEKLCDALLTKTIPIYWGCPNIDDFFNTEGMIICESAEDIIEVCKNLDYSKYESMLEHVNENFEEAKKYCVPLTERIETEIKRVMKPKNKKDILLSVGILTINGRENYFNRLMHHIKLAANKWAEQLEIIVAKDNREASVGTKRNQVLDQSNGKFVCFIDDDDMISAEYFDDIMNSIIENGDKIDVIGFDGLYYVDEKPVMVFKHSSKFNDYRTLENDIIVQYRKCNHLNPVKTKIARQVRYNEISYGEDSDYSTRLYQSELLKSETYIGKILYHYLYSDTTTETQGVRV